MADIVIHDGHGVENGLATRCGVSPEPSEHVILSFFFQERDTYSPRKRLGRIWFMDR